MSRLGNVGGRLYRGEVSFDFVGRQKLWYSISGLILVLALVGLFARGLNFSVDFKGGSVIQFPATSSTSLDAGAERGQRDRRRPGRHRPARGLGEQRHLAGPDRQADLRAADRRPGPSWPGN